jgi:hypothetical protein
MDEIQIPDDRLLKLNFYSASFILALHTLMNSLVSGRCHGNPSFSLLA